MLCPNCNYDNTFYSEFSKLEYCRNCGQDLKKPVQAAAGGELYDTLLEIDEVAGELLIKKESLFGSPKVDKRIPLSEIQEVTCGPETQHSHTGLFDFYRGYCDLLIGGVWQSSSLPSERDALRVAAAIGRRLENPQEKSRELVNHLYKLLFGVSMTTDKEQRVGLQEPLRLSEKVTLTTKYTIDPESYKTQARELQSWGAKGQALEIEGMIPLRDSDVNSTLLLHTDVSDHYYLLGYSVAGKTVDSVWTHRKKRAFSGKCVGVEWKGGALSEQLNSDESLQELLLNELRTHDCDAHVTNDQSRGNTVIIFGDCYPRQWVQLPKSLFPSESRIKAVKMIAKKVREFSG